MRRIRIGVAGAGLIGQVEHIPNILSLHEQFELIGVADPSVATRDYLSKRYGFGTYSSVDDLLDLRPEAIVVGTPDSYHWEITGQALDAGIHVFCEKPLSLSVSEIDALLAKRDASGVVLQVGYMKRWDPSYEMLIEAVTGLGERLRFIGVEVNDPDYWPFVEHYDLVRPNDVAPDLIAENKRKLKQQVELATGAQLNQDALRAYAESFSSNMIHDLNAVLGLLDHMKVTDRRAISASFFAGGQGSSAVMSLGANQAICHLSHVTVPKLADYSERISLFFDDRRFELTFPSPYLKHFPSRLVTYQSDGHRLESTEHRNGFQEAFIRELTGFWQSIVAGEPVRNTAEEARTDMLFLERFMSLALTNAASIPSVLSKGAILT